MDLFSKHLFPSSGKRIYIYEGELDAASGGGSTDMATCISTNRGSVCSRSQSKKIWNSYKDTKKSFYSSTMTPPVVTLLNKTASVLPPGRVFMPGWISTRMPLMTQPNDIDTLKALMWNA